MDKFNCQQINPHKFTVNQLQLSLPFILTGGLLQHLTGRYFYQGGKYWMYDQTGNGRHAEIIDFDLDANWVTNRWSYNSTARIKQPVDIDLFNADVNRFWYTSIATPREIPIVSLFQDIYYSHNIFCKHVPKSYYDGYVTDICTYSTALTGSQLSAAQIYFGVPTEQVANVHWVSSYGNDIIGTGTKINPYRTVTHAIAVAADGDIIYLKYNVAEKLPAGTDKADLTGRSLKIYGTGYSVISIGGIDASLITLTNNCEFRNLIFNRFFVAPTTNMIKITGGTSTFTLCNMGRAKNAYDSEYAQRPMDISGAATINWNGGHFLCGTFVILRYAVIHDTSEFNCTVGMCNIAFDVKDNAVLNANVDKYINGGSSIWHSNLYNNSITTFNIRTRAYFCNAVTMAEEEDSFQSGLFSVYDNIVLNLSGNRCEGAIECNSGSPVVNLTNVTALSGRCWYAVSIGANPAMVFNITDCHLVYDVDNDITGMHIIEDDVGIHWNIKNSYLEFSGHSGKHKTLGSTIAINGHNTNLVIEDSHIIDNVNDGIPFGYNYPMCIHSYRYVTIRNSIIENRNYDGVSGNKCLYMGKYPGESIHLLLDNVTFKSDVYGGSGFAVIIPLLIALDANDWLCETGTINQTQEIFITNDIPAWNYLKGNCPP